MIQQLLQDDLPLWLVFVVPALGLATIGLIGLWKLIDPTFRRTQQPVGQARGRPITEIASGQPKFTAPFPLPPPHGAQPARPPVGRSRDTPAGTRKPSRSHSRKRRERRGALRRDGNPFPVLISGDESGEPVAGSVIDRSRGGVSLRAAAGFPLGAVVRVRSMQFADIAPWVEVEVKHCRAVEGDWVLGCKFKTPQPWNILLLFG
jgi:hypothetical protein